MKRDTFGLHALVDGFLFTLQSEGRAAKTVKYYSTLLRPFLAYADSHAWPDRVDLIHTQHIREFLSWVSTRKVEYRAGNGSRRTTAPTPVTAWNYFKAVRRLFNWAVQEHLVESNPVANIHFKRPPSAPVMPYSKQDLQKLLSVCDLDVKSGARFVGLRGKAVILLFIDTLARLNELEKLGMNDLDLQQKLARVVRKGGEVQYLPFSAGTAKILWFYLQERQKRAKCDFVFVTEEGKGFATEGLGGWFALLKQRADAKSPGRTHRLRHTGALEFLRNTKDPFLLQMLMGHKDLAMTRRYLQGLRQQEAIEMHRNGGSPVRSLGLT